MSKPGKGISNGLTNYGDPRFAAYLRRSFASSMGYSRTMLEKPVIGVTWTASGFNNCHRGVPELVEAVKRGVLASSGLPMAGNARCGQPSRSQTLQPGPIGTSADGLARSSPRA